MKVSENPDESSVEAPSPLLYRHHPCCIAPASAALTLSYLFATTLISSIATSLYATWEDFKPVRGNPWTMLRDLCCQKTFWRFAAFTLITINLKMVFRHLDATLPKYLVREFGPKIEQSSTHAIIILISSGTLLL